MLAKGSPGETSVGFGLAFIPACMSNLTHSIVWDGITLPFPNVNGFSVEVWEWISNFYTCFIMDVITYPCRDESYYQFEILAIFSHLPKWCTRRVTLDRVITQFDCTVFYMYSIAIVCECTIKIHNVCSFCN